MVPETVRWAILVMAPISADEAASVSLAVAATWGEGIGLGYWTGTVFWQFSTRVAPLILLEKCP